MCVPNALGAKNEAEDKQSAKTVRAGKLGATLNPAIHRGSRRELVPEVSMLPKPSASFLKLAARLSDRLSAVFETSGMVRFWAARNNCVGSFAQNDNRRFRTPDPLCFCSLFHQAILSPSRRALEARVSSPREERHSWYSVLLNL